MIAGDERKYLSPAAKKGGGIGLPIEPPENRSASISRDEIAGRSRPDREQAQQKQTDK
jgi:hypothetical protein